jgi:hypothetical protein
LKKKNLQRLASLAAVGAGAVIATADKAEAGTIVYSGPLDVQVGWSASPSAVARTTINLASAAIHFYTHTRTPAPFYHYRSIRFSASGAKPLVAGISTLMTFLRGSAFPVHYSANSMGLVAARGWNTHSGAHHLAGHPPFQNIYAFFTLPLHSPNPLYGWIELSYSATSATGNSPAYGPLLTVEGWAYDTTGARIQAGDTGSATPEPDTFGSTGLAALALGAAGMRRWRAARQ